MGNDNICQEGDHQNQNILQPFYCLGWKTEKPRVQLYLCMIKFKGQPLQWYTQRKVVGKSGWKGKTNTNPQSKRSQGKRKKNKQKKWTANIQTGEMRHRLSLVKKDDWSEPFKSQITCCFSREWPVFSYSPRTHPVHICCAGIMTQSVPLPSHKSFDLYDNLVTLWEGTCEE